MRAVVFLPPPRLADFALARLTSIHPDVVPDSVDPAAASLDDSSVSSVDVPPGVPWEVLHPRLLDETREGGRKRVRIDSPVIVIETPTRPISIAPVVDRIATETTEEEGDTSKVIVGPDSDEEVSPNISLLQKVPTIRADVGTASVDEQVRSASQSASSLQVRAPRPAHAPPPTCRFTFFRRASHVSSASVSAAHTTSHDTSEALPPEQEGAVDHHAGGVNLLRTLPAMNAYEASFNPPSGGEDEAGCQGEGSLGDSIVPPPTLHFTLAQITSLSSILSPHSHPRRETPGAASSRLNLLVVIREIGYSTRVRRLNTTTTRLELLVMDGALTRSGVEKHLLKLVLWDHLTLTPLQPGDVVYVQNVSIQPPDPKPRLGPGFPRATVAHAAHSHNSSIQLCYRSNPTHPSDAALNFDPAIAAFDAKSNRILQLVELWNHTPT
ncbi:uncharacterized protein PAN0_011c4238 [Moesziomyces antarcticus]|uniref:Uncharacterized protein n=2 Tax=Pseudozyma antarctica TaxID=84753 RepID=A0A5C3FTE3_PSEA2|nr:uncharacterized protein PAN0_011c4238 [Moesziomyces antarcticus]GAK66016.1 conserved hypothetical protein [Moesziomyces antarcticus]SPO46791.1 uncharacterized protein PSANT_04477 [Moesziomyces antarcticus]